MYRYDPEYVYRMSSRWAALNTIHCKHSIEKRTTSLAATLDLNRKLSRHGRYLLRVDGSTRFGSIVGSDILDVPQAFAALDDRTACD